MEKKQRNSSLELLRIFSILFIIFHHYAIYGVNAAEQAFSYNEYFLDISMVFVHISVNCFVLISGYFMSRQRITLRKLLRMLGEVWFYSVAVLLLFMTVLKPETPVGISTIVKSLFPVGYGQYWFVTGFILLMIFSPYMNMLTERLTRRQHFVLLLIMYALWSVSSTLFSTVWGFYDTLWLFVLYFTGAYIRSYFSQNTAAPEKHLRRALLLTIIMCLLTWGLNFVGHEFSVRALYDNKCYFVRQNSVLALAASIEFFLYFLTRKPFYSKAVNLISSASFGVYLIHEHVLMRPYLWHSICRVGEWYFSPWMPLHALICVLGVFAVCTALDIIRAASLEKLWMRLVDRFADDLQAKAEEITDRILALMTPKD